ncbi:uncharacterized protein A4U43_C03F4320 [Asparagus officinalis]|uniref:VQ domain-containing protein n=1 Tax=Asparagus officinalis TaxID=4686 RepID=A0A5P1FBP5_ASPOF|nr:uncharacterized protein A4U43_C03F4320 [Asparagus officinalis]
MPSPKRPLRVAEGSYQIKKPVIIHLRPPKIIHARPQDFMSVVQSLTGYNRSAGSSPTEHKSDFEGRKDKMLEDVGDSDPLNLTLGKIPDMGINLVNFQASPGFVLCSPSAKFFCDPQTGNDDFESYACLNSSREFSCDPQTGNDDFESYACLRCRDIDKLKEQIF